MIIFLQNDLMREGLNPRFTTQQYSTVWVHLFIQSGIIHYSDFNSVEGAGHTF